MMIFIIIMGLFTYFKIQRQMFPNFDLNYIQVSAAYRGASPQEIEESILIKMEEALKDVTEIEEMNSRAFRNSGQLTLEIATDKDLPEVLDKVKARVDSIATFPAGMEPVNVRQIEITQDVIEMSLVGDFPLEELKPIAKKIEDELLLLNNVSLVELSAPSDEISVEVQPEALRKYNLTLSDISNAIRRYSANYSAGQLRTDSGLIAVRIENQYYDGHEFNQIPVKIGDNGARVLLGDVATVHDGFTEGLRYNKFSGQNSVYMSVKATKDQNMVAVSKSVKEFIDMRNPTLPKGMELKILVDMTYYLNARLDMMLSNLFQGSILVALMLTIFLRFRLAFWVMIGLPVCFLGAVMLMPTLGVTINIMSLFAFIMVLGIVVDDAIVIGESVYTEVEKTGGGVDNVVRGAQRVATPATFGVLTTIAVFAPFMAASGPQGTFFTNISGVVILCLIFSLIESKLILPAHLAHTKFTPVKSNSWRSRFNKAFNNFVYVKYKGALEKCIEYRWSVMIAFTFILVASATMMMVNHVRFIPQPKVPDDYPSIAIEMNETVSDQQTIDAIQSIEAMVMRVERQIIEETGGPMMKDILAFNNSRNAGRIVVPLVEEEKRAFDSFELARRWRENMPEIPGMKSITVKDSVIGGAGGQGDFGYLIYGPDLDVLNAAGRQFMKMLSVQKGLFDISSTLDANSKEIQMELKPVAYDLGLSLQSIANQMGTSFYGGEAQRVLRNGEEVRVMVRYPELTREQFSELKYATITTPSGNEVMLGDVVTLTEKPGISYIRRENGFRSVYVFGSIDQALVEPTAVVETIKEDLLPELKDMFPTIKTELGGAIEEEQDQLNEQLMFFVAGMLLVYILLAVPLKSYSQPMIIMSVIPFGFVGAVIGHFIIGIDMSMMSTFGLVAAAGVVINDSLVMTDYVNQMRKEGLSTLKAVVAAGCVRFRAITLTSITTFVGVLPIMFETSLQARFVIPMATALGFAVLFATVVTLILVPCLYMILEDTKDQFKTFGGLFGRAYRKMFGTEAPAVSQPYRNTSHTSGSSSYNDGGADI
ncbi:efflux RND transporter permease subunit [Psychrosphaera ytuae]|uniref:Efflux RND transporter permease subunit n=1 Tax=Psychrosphaera ytuae TaxID=2820710 RepID=A0A975DGS3_9GAMM|nr:efflux RND transporter permease subunit [Psychrosphaera ytuae]QTH65365.1 efflux RND transporter permease subunit [Psychrosphaera ytuae]